MKIAKLAAVLCAAICILSLTACEAKETTKAETEQEQQKAVLSFSTTDLDGNPVDSSILKDYDLVIVNMFADWCKFSPRELKALQKIHEEYADKNVLVLGVVSKDDDQEAIRKMISEAGVTYPVVYYTDDFKTVDANTYRPQSALLGKAGVVIPMTTEDLLEPQAELIRADIESYMNGEYEEEKNSQAYSDYFSKLVLASKSEEYLMEIADMYALGAIQPSGEFSGDLTYEGWKILIDSLLEKQK